MTLILLRSDVLPPRGCTEGLAQFDARAAEQSGVDFGDVIGNGIDCYYPDGFTDDELLRIAESGRRGASTVRWLVTKYKLRPSAETHAEVRRLHKLQMAGR